MPGDPFQPVMTGEKLEIPAPAYNAFLDAARFVRGKFREADRDDEPEFRQSGIVKVRNDSGGDRDRFDVLGIGGPVVEPGDDLQQFQNRVLLTGMSPYSTFRGRFVILLEPLRSGSIGRAVISGVTVGRVWIDPEDPELCCADVRDGDPSCLEINEEGAAQVLRREPGYGKKWAVFRIGHVCPC